MTTDDDRKALADLIYDDQREQCDLDPEGFYDCEQLADRILAAGFRRTEKIRAAALEEAEKSMRDQAERCRNVLSDCTNKGDRLMLRHRAEAYACAADKIRALIAPTPPQADAP